MSELCALTISQIHSLLRARKLSRRELVQAHLDRVGAVNPQVNAIVELRAEAALAEAAALDADPKGRDDRPLDGIPVSIKDHFDVESMLHTEGVKTMQQRRSPHDEIAVKRLRDAGAIIIGKCNQPDFQIRWNTVSDLYGATRNPRDLSLTSGGSSGGDAAAVAAGMAPLGLGADYGGSIRVPASFCGIYGLRPSAGRIPAVAETEPFDGPPTLDLMCSTGPFARSIEDLETTYRVLAGPDPRDPATVPVPLDAGASSGKRPRVAMMTDETGATLTGEIRKRLKQTAEILEASGYEVTEAGIPHARRAPEVWAELVGTELLQSAMPVWAPQLGASGRQHIEMMFGIYALGDSVDRYIRSFMERRSIARETAQWMETYQLVLAPVAGMPAPPLDFDHFLDRTQTIELFDKMRNVMWVNLLSLPSIALPNGIQIVARRFRETAAFTAAAIVERVTGPVSIANPVGSG
jgi:amidase